MKKPTTAVLNSAGVVAQSCLVPVTMVGLSSTVSTSLASSTVGEVFKMSKETFSGLGGTISRPVSEATGVSGRAKPYVGGSGKKLKENALESGNNV